LVTAVEVVLDGINVLCLELTDFCFSRFIISFNVIIPVIALELTPKVERFVEIGYDE
jgi:hypothetical protein